LYLRGKRKQSGETVDPDFYFYWLEPEENDDFEDPATWAKVNPAIAGGWWPIENLERRRKSLPLPEFQRYHLNMWTRTQEESWLPDGLWTELADSYEMDTSLPTFAGVDMAIKHDSVAVVWGQMDPESGLIYLDSKIWRNDGVMFDYAEIETFLNQLNIDFNMSEVAYDPAFFERSAQALYDLNVPMVEFPQTHGRIVQKRIRHKNQSTFNDQVLSAVNRPTDRGFRLSKGKSKRKIDGAIAMVMCLDRLTFPTRPPEDSNIGIVEW
jgi:phage terminase large subunit-like protein